MNVNKLRGRIVERGLTMAEVANHLDINRASLYRKMNSEGETLTIKEANKIVELLEINPEEATEIFFGEPVA